MFIWGYIFRDVFRNLFGLNSLLGQKSTVILGIAIIHMWIDVGINMLVYLSSLTTVPKELYESADLDGATRIQQFFRVTAAYDCTGIYHLHNPVADLWAA